MVTVGCNRTMVYGYKGCLRGSLHLLDRDYKTRMGR